MSIPFSSSSVRIVENNKGGLISMKAKSLLLLLNLLFTLILITACGNQISENEPPTITTTATSSTITTPTPTPSEAQKKKIRVTYVQSDKQTASQKETQDMIEKSIQFQYELTEAILNEMNVEYSFEKLPNDNDVYTSIVAGDSDAAFGYQTNSKEVRFDYSYSYMYAIIKFSSFDYKGYHTYIIKKGNAEILDILNGGIKKIKENGKYAEVYKKFFGDDDSRSILQK
ncbi:ABC transporter substrate-binding protein [Paenibacillus sp. N1-5-1-14]|uniref:substrate-binding periplasmic protein n=1 Tax=Paenibacillus radicibacter TaxID=2972488 RepID=UPI00215927BE|nr:ABC transporter substrate-binding protein [Paenibacillus radicibacter]MCR8641512.1 ABC transporter substrate-binding protein [Paenibacillus radicibacter]